MISTEKVTEIIESYIKNTTYFIVNVTVSPSNIIDVQIDSMKPVDMDYVVELSRHVDSTLDHDVEDFSLTLGSAGITTPFKVLNQYKKNIGNPVEVLIKDGKKVKGQLIGADEAGFDVEITEMVRKDGDKRKKAYSTPLRFAYDDVKSTIYAF